METALFVASIIIGSIIGIPVGLLIVRYRRNH